MAISGINFGNLGSNISTKVAGWDKAATTFFHSPSTLQGSLFSQGPKVAAKESFRTIGSKLNGVTYNVANKAGDKLVGALAKNPSGWLSKVPGISTVANGLSKLGKTGGSKIPGLGTIVAVGTGLWGVVKAAGKALKGDFKGAGHQLVKSAGSVAGIAAGIALMATGVGFLPGLALAVGAGFAGDWVGNKAADMAFGQVDPETGHSISYLQKQGAAQQSSYNSSNPFDPALGSDAEFNKYISGVLSSPHLY